MLKEAFLGRQPSHFKVNPFVRAFIVAESFLWSALNLTTPIFAVFVASSVAGGNVETAAFSFTVYYILRVIFELTTGRYLVGSSEKKKIATVLLGLFVTGLSYLGFAYAPTIILVYLFQGLSGVGLGIASPPKNALFSTHLDRNKEATEWGWYDATVFIGMGLAASLGGLVAASYGFKTLFIISAVVVWLAMIPYLLYIKKNNLPPQSHL